MLQAESKTFSDEAIRRFLLGGLNSNEQTAFEHSLFVDPLLEERVRLTELELSDEYSANRLSAADRDLFRRQFLLTTERQTKLEVSRALYDSLAVPKVVASTTFWESVVGIFDIRRHAWKYAFATLTLILLLLATALLIKKDQSRLVFRTPKAGPRPSASSTPRMAAHSTNAPAPSHSETSPTLPLHEGLTTSVVLYSGTPLEAAPTISTDGDIVMVQLKLDGQLAESYEVTITLTTGESVFSAAGLRRTEDQMLSFEVPTSSITRGDFQANLTRVDSASKQNAGTYYFRVR
jgi:hypothetical protein